MRRMAVGIGLAAALVAAPATASGAVSVSISGGTLTIVGSDADESVSIGSAGSNDLGPTTDVSGGGADMVAGGGCQGFGATNGPANDNSVFCPTNSFQRIAVTLGGGEDEFSAGNPVPMTVDAGAGDDELVTGSGPDVVLGGPGDDVLELDANGAAGTTSEVGGGEDDDELRIGRDSRATVVRGGDGLDTATYRFASGARTVRLDNLANDGGTGEGDDVRTDVEVVIGGSSGDTLVSSDVGNTLDGAGGTDRLEGLGGPGHADRRPGDQRRHLRRPGRRRDHAPRRARRRLPRRRARRRHLRPGPHRRGHHLQRGRLTLPRCVFPLITGVRPDLILIRAVDEGPSVRMTVASPAVSRAGVRVRLACPAALRRPCAGPLRVFTSRGRRPLATLTYSVRPGRATTVVLALDAQAPRAALATATLRVVSVEKGRSRLGPKTTIRLVRPGSPPRR